MKTLENKKKLEYYTPQSLSNESSLNFSGFRLKLVACLGLLVFLVLLVRASLILLTPPSSEVLDQLASRQYNRSINLAPYRGAILDRRDEPLAISLRKPSIFVNPRVFSPNRHQVKSLSKALDLPSKEIQTLATKNSYFYWVKRKIPTATANKVMDLKINGVHFVLEPSRYYPGGLASQLIGYVGIDNKGLLGLELLMDSLLRGDQQTNVMNRDARGRIIHSQSDSAAPQKPGHRIHLTLDRVIQEISEKALARGVEAAKAKSGFVIVSDPHTGHILALANAPKFDPNNSHSITPTNTRNFGFLDLFEPGSVVKPLVIARALALRKTSLAEAFQTHKGVYREENLRIRDTHESDELSTEDILVESSNIGTYKIAKRLGSENLYHAYRDFGVGEKEFIISRNQQSLGRISNWKSWKPVRFANISFGQGLLTSGIEIVQAYGALANGGNLMKPILIDKILDHRQHMVQNNPPKVLRRVISETVARKMAQTLEKVVEHGTGGNAKSKFYSVAGKTGTSEKADPVTRGYAKDLRIASFAGFSPVEDPHLVIYVVIDEPGNKPYYGGTWAAPVFKEINEKVLRYLNVAPDKHGPPLTKSPTNRVPF